MNTETLGKVHVSEYHLVHFLFMIITFVTCRHNSIALLIAVLLDINYHLLC